MNDKKVVATFQKQKVLVLSFVLCTGKKFLALAARSHCISRQIKNSPNLVARGTTKTWASFSWLLSRSVRVFFSLSLFVWNTHSQPVSSGQQCSIPPPSPLSPTVTILHNTCTKWERERELHSNYPLSFLKRERTKALHVSTCKGSLTDVRMWALISLSLSLPPSLSLLVFLT